MLGSASFLNYTSALTCRDCNVTGPCEMLRLDRSGTYVSQKFLREQKRREDGWSPRGSAIASAANYHREARHYLLGQMGAKTRPSRGKGHFSAQESVEINFLEILYRDLRCIFSISSCYKILILQKEELQIKMLKTELWISYGSLVILLPNYQNLKVQICNHFFFMLMLIKVGLR